MTATLRRAVIVLAALVLLWRVLQVNIASYDESGYARLSTVSVPAVAAAGSDRVLLQRLLDENPGHIEALLVMARDLENGGDARQARRLYQAAFQLAPLDREVLGAGADYFLRQGAVAESLVLLDRLVDSYADTRPRVFPVLARMLEQGHEAATWKDWIARKRTWLGPFVVAACQAGTDPAHLVPIVLDRASDARAGAAEIGCVIERLRETDRWREGYQVWLNTLPRERLADVGHVFNGSFEFAPSGMGFDWRMSRARERDVGHTVEISQVAGASGQRALRVSYNGKRQTGQPVVQYLALEPGRYELSGLARQQSIGAGRGVRWTVRCMKAGAAGTPIAASERFVGSSEWRRFAFELAIPAGCGGQILQLEPVGIEEGPVYLAGTAWFDELVLRRRG